MARGQPLQLSVKHVQSATASTVLHVLYNIFKGKVKFAALEALHKDTAPTAIHTQTAECQELIQPPYLFGNHSGTERQAVSGNSIKVNLPKNHLGQSSLLISLETKGHGKRHTETDWCSRLEQGDQLLTVTVQLEMLRSRRQGGE